MSLESSLTLYRTDQLAGDPVRCCVGEWRRRWVGEQDETIENSFCIFLNSLRG